MISLWFSLTFCDSRQWSNGRDFVLQRRLLLLLSEVGFRQMHIAVGGLKFPVAHQIFEIGKGHAFVHFMCSKRVAQRVNTGPFLDTGFLHMLFDNVASG